MKQPSCFLVGAPKCGTTALCKYLNRHPDIFVPREKELRYFDRDLREVKKTLDEYLSFFAEGEGKLCGEGTPSYLYSQVAAKNIHAFNPEAKIIIMLRDPVTVMYAYHSQQLFNGSSENIQDFKLALDAEADRKMGKNIPTKCANPKKLFYREVVKFTFQVERYFNTFGREQVHAIVFDDFVQDTAKVYRETLQFLGVDPRFETYFDKKNSNKKVRNTTLQTLLKYPPAKVLEIGKVFVPLPPSMRRALLEGVKQKLKRFNTKHVPRPPLDPELRRSLQKEFAPEVERLSNLLGRDLTHWSRDL